MDKRKIVAKSFLPTFTRYGQCLSTILGNFPTSFTKKMECWPRKKNIFSSSSFVVTCKILCDPTLRRWFESTKHAKKKYQKVEIKTFSFFCRKKKENVSDSSGTDKTLKPQLLDDYLCAIGQKSKNQIWPMLNYILSEVNVVDRC